jgi:hypothetical protein
VGWLPELPEEDPPCEPLVRVVGAVPLEVDPDEDVPDDDEEPVLVRVVGALPLELYPDEDAADGYEEPVLVRVTGAPDVLPAAYAPPDAACELVLVAAAPPPAWADPP